MNTDTPSKNNRLHGRKLGMPYDLRKPTWERLKERWWNKDGPMFTPKLWGWGWDLNLRHPGSWVLLSGLTVLIVVLVQLQG